MPLSWPAPRPYRGPPCAAPGSGLGAVGSPGPALRTPLPRLGSWAHGAVTPEVSVLRPSLPGPALTMPSGCRCIQLVSLLWILGASGQPTHVADDCSSHCDLAHGCCEPDGTCRCDPGWEGIHCERCVRMPGCQHGTCHQPWQCICRSGWAGKFCDKDEHICTKQPPCQNGGKCVYEGDGEYHCVCPAGFHGHNCERKTGPCERAGSPCRNGGLCQDDQGFAENFTCRCLAGFVGPRCEVNVDDCLMRPCANGATCHDGINRFSCHCPEGFAGRFCTVNLDDCASRPCQHGARCRDRVHDFDCLCPDGYGGKTCEIVLPAPDLPTEPDSAPGPSPAAVVPFTVPAPFSVGAGLLRISVKEVVRQQEAGIGESSLLVLVVLGVLTATLVLTTGLLILWAWRHGHCPTTPCCYPFRQYAVPPEQHDRECQVSMLPAGISPPASSPSEPGKTTAL